MSKLLLLIDFDGVLAQWDGEWRDGILGAPMPNARKAMFLLTEKLGFRVEVFTARDPTEVQGWLRQFGFPPLRVTNYKSSCHAYIDDRALCFQGVWNDDFLKQIRDFTPHWKQPQPSESASACSEQTGSPAGSD